MSKTLVCILEQETILNYLFVKELFNDGEKVLLISQRRDAPLIERFASLFPEIEVNSIILAKDGDEDLWDTICRTIRFELSHNEKYAINLSGGTRLMSIAVQQVFEKYDSQFYFMPIDRNVIIHSQIDDNNDNNDDEIIEIKHRVSVEEYLKINDIRCTTHTVDQSEEYATHFLTLFTQNYLSNNDYKIIETLRNSNSKVVNYNDIDGLDRFIKYINFPTQHSWGLTRDEVQYIIGGWFEEYIFYTVKNAVAPDNIATGVVIKRNNNHNNDINELDVVFTLDNRLFVIECKTGISKVSLYHNIVYKACAIKEALLGIRAKTYILSLNNDPKDRLKITARNMDITFCDKNFVLQSDKMKELFFNTLQ